MNSDWQAAITILREIESKSSLVFWHSSPTPDSESIKAAFKTLAQGDSKELLPRIASFVSSDHKELRKQASIVFIELALRLPPLTWPKLDEELRRYGAIPRTKTFKTSDNPAWIIIAACHSFGFTREKAIGLFNLLPPLIASCLLLVRINDWVLPIREKARKVFTNSVGFLNADQKMAILPLIHRLRDCGRQDNIAMIDQWVTIISNQFDETSWLQSWRSCQQKERRIYMDVIKVSNRPPSPVIRDAILRSGDRFALFWYIRHILPNLEEPERLSIGHIISKSRAVPVRREWITFLVETSPDKAIEKLKKMLTDSSRGLRSFARFHLSRTAPMDFAEIYRQLLMNPYREALALTSLAEVEPNEANVEAISRLQSPVPAIRKAAIQALSENSLVKYIDYLFEQMGSTIPGVPKIAKNRLFQIPGPFSQYLLSHLQQFAALPAPIQNSLVRSANGLGKWAALEFLLNCSLTPHLKESTAYSFRIWSSKLNRSFTSLSPTKRIHLQELVEITITSESFRNYLRFILKDSNSP